MAELTTSAKSNKIRFSPMGHATMTALVDRLIPHDEFSPSASENGFWDYFSYRIGKSDPKYVSWFLVGFSSLLVEVDYRFGKPFHELDCDNQDFILRDLEAGNVKTNWPISAQDWFNRLNNWVAEGYYSDPEHNHGNLGKASWVMIGFDERK